MDVEGVEYKKLPEPKSEELKIKEALYQLVTNARKLERLKTGVWLLRRRGTEMEIEEQKDILRNLVKNASDKILNAQFLERQEYILVGYGIEVVEYTLLTFNKKYIKSDFFAQLLLERVGFSLEDVDIKQNKRVNKPKHPNPSASPSHSASEYTRI